MQAMQAQPVTLDDKYELESGRIFVSGVQALVRLPMMQRARDAAQGLNTAAFISGYRGSPLGGYDMNLWRAQRFLERNHITTNAAEIIGIGQNRNPPVCVHCAKEQKISLRAVM